MALIPQDPKQRNAALVGLAALVVGVVFYQYWYTPKSTELTEMKDHVEALEGKNRAAQITAARGGGQIEERLAAYERHVMVLEKLIPASDEVPALLREITSETRRLIGSDPSNFRPEPDEPGEFYTKKAYQMQVIGEYHDVARMLASIAALSRIITPVDLTVTAATNAQGPALATQENPIVADFRIETYVLPQPGEAGVPPAARVGG